MTKTTKRRPNSRANKSTPVEIGGKTFQVGEMTARQARDASDELFAFFQAMQSIGGGTLSLAQLIQAAPDALFGLLALVIDESVEFIENSALSETLDLGEAWWEHNETVFFNRLLPVIMPLIPREILTLLLPQASK